MSKETMKQLSTYLPEDSTLYQAVMSECKHTGQGVSAILRLALTEHYERQLEQYRAQQFAPDQVPATP